MATDILRIIVDEVVTTIKQTFDDKEVSQAQAAFWVIVAANKMKGQHISKRDSGQFMKTFPEVPVKVSSVNSNPNIIKGRKYIELPENIFDFDKDMGVEYIAYYNENDKCGLQLGKGTITRTTPSELEWLELNTYTRPSPKNPYWYRTSNIIYLRGIENVPVKFVEMGLYTTIDPLAEIDIDQPFDFPQELLEDLKRRVVDLARFSFIFNSQSDNVNDGSNSAEAASIAKVASVNNQNQEQ